MHIPFQDKMQYWRKMGYIFSIVALYTRKDFQRFAGLEKACKIYAKIDQKFIENVNSSLCWKNCAVNYAYATLSTTARFRFCGSVSNYRKSSLKFFQKVPQ